jgi:MerR family redox-sensitive transcriptional activator SoxR
MAQRCSVAASALRYYEKLGLISTERVSNGGHRRYRESTFHKINYITLAQRAGFSLEEIKEQFAILPARLPPSKEEWAPLSELWIRRIDQHIAELKQLKIEINNCSCSCT